MATLAAACFVLAPPSSRAETPAPLQSYSSTLPAGRTLFNVASRLGILNLVSAYALALDNSDAEAWFRLFADEAVFVDGTGGGPPVALSGTELRKHFSERVEALRKAGVKQRHLLSDVVLLEETPTKAHISVVGLLATTQDGKAFKAVAALNDEAWLVNVNGEWKIARWNDFSDSPVE
jgi:hypothetical protein